jgi:hypothetical protein
MKGIFQKIAVHIIVCVFLSVVMGITFFAFSQGSSWGLFVGLFIGCPVGSVLGILLLRKWYFKDEKISLLEGLLALILCCVGARFAALFLDRIGGFPSFIVFQLIIVTLSLSGFYLCRYLRQVVASFRRSRDR